MNDMRILKPNKGKHEKIFVALNQIVSATQSEYFVPYKVKIRLSKVLNHDDKQQLQAFALYFPVVGKLNEPNTLCSLLLRTC